VRRALALVGAALLLLGPAACGADDQADSGFHPSTVAPEDVTTAAPAPDPTDFPPEDAHDLESIYGAQLAAIGLKLTDRGGLIDRTGGGYGQSTTGTHLALYVQPTGERNLAQYLDGIRSVAAIFVDAFERWPALESFDVCQEPVPNPASPAKGEPLPVTQIELSRAQADAIDFSTATVADLVRLSRQDPPGIQLRVSSAVAKDDAYKAIVDAADG
jgi:hypothetical protein